MMNHQYQKEKNNHVYSWINIWEKRWWGEPKNICSCLFSLCTFAPAPPTIMQSRPQHRHQGAHSFHWHSIFRVFLFAWKNVLANLIMLLFLLQQIQPALLQLSGSCFSSPRALRKHKALSSCCAPRAGQRPHWLHTNTAWLAFLPTSTRWQVPTPNHPLRPTINQRQGQ